MTMRRSSAVCLAGVSAAVLTFSTWWGMHAPSSDQPGDPGVAQGLVGDSSTAPEAAPRDRTPSGGRARAARLSRLVTGPAIQTPYGSVQVAVRMHGARLIDVIARRLTDANAHSRQLSAAAAPILRREALQRQTGGIDAVSGATFTSEGYRRSLQAALDRAARTS